MANNSNKTNYFANEADNAIIGRLQDKVQVYVDFCESYSYFDKVRKSLAYYSGGTLENGQTSWKLNRGGEDGEVLFNFENHYRSLATSLLNLTTAQRPAVEVISKNSDKESLSRAIVAKGLIDYHLTEVGLEAQLRETVETAIIAAEGFLFVDWDRGAGDKVGAMGPDGQPTEEAAGDVRIRMFSTFDVVRDPKAKSWRECQWVILRHWVNKFDLCADYAEVADKIVAMGPGDEDAKWTFEDGREDTELVAMYEFYHNRTPARPEGKYVKYVGGYWLEGGPLPYKKIPLYRCAPAELKGTPFGNTTMFDLLGGQETINGIDTSITTNQLGRGIGNMLVPSTANLTVEQISTSMNLMKFDGEQKPEALIMPPTPPEFFQYKKDKISAMEVISGVGSVVRGNPSENVGADASGSKLALLQVQAIQQNSGLEKQAVQLIRDVCLGIVHVYRDFGGSLPRIMKILGKQNQYLVREFVPENEFADIDQISVDIGNPMTRQISGRMAMADRLAELGLIKPENANAYITLMKEGTIDPMIQGQQAQNMRIEEENEHLMEGKPHRALITDPHWIEIPKHLELLDNPDLRTEDPANQAVQQAVLQAVMEHSNLFRAMPPELVLMRGGQEALQMWQLMQQMAAGAPQALGMDAPKPAPGGGGKAPGKPASAPQTSVQDDQKPESMAAQPKQPSLPPGAVGPPGAAGVTENH